MKRLLVLLSLLAALLLWSSETFALPRVRLKADDAVICGTPEAIAKRLAAHGVEIVDPQTSQDASVVEVEIRATRSASGADGVLVVGTSERRVAAESCDAVLDALALGLVLALDEPSAPTPPKPPSTEPTAPPSKEDVPPPRVSRPTPAYEWRLEASSGFFFGATPSPAPTVAGLGQIGSARPSGFVPALRLGAIFVLPSRTKSDPATVSFAMQGALLDACPLRYGSRAVGIRQCARALVTRLQARSEGFSDARLDNDVWAAVLVAVRGEILFLTSFHAEIDLAAGLPLARPAFLVGNTEVFAVSPVVASASLAVGVHFP